MAWGDGLYCLKKGEMKQLCVLPQCNVFNLYQDSSGDIWVCTWEDGLYHISDNGTVHYTDGGADRTHCISSNSVRDCCEDNQGNLWIATFNGLDKFDKKKNEFVYYTSTDIPGSLSNASVYCIIKDHQGTLWVGTYFGGVNYFNPEYEIYTHYRPGLHENEGLSFPVMQKTRVEIYGLLPKEVGWISMIVPTSVSSGISIKRDTTLFRIIT